MVTCMLCQVYFHSEFCYFLAEAKIKGLAAPNNISVTQTLEGHSGKCIWAFGLLLVTTEIQDFVKLIE